MRCSAVLEWKEEKLPDVQSERRFIPFPRPCFIAFGAFYDGQAETAGSQLRAAVVLLSSRESLGTTWLDSHVSITISAFLARNHFDSCPKPQRKGKIVSAVLDNHTNLAIVFLNSTHQPNYAPP